MTRARSRRHKKEAWPLVATGLLVLLFLAIAGCGYNLAAQRAMLRDIDRYPRNPDTQVVTVAEATTLLGNGRNAVLLVHGFSGAHTDFNTLGQTLQAKGISVRLMRLPGHGTFVVQQATVSAEQLIEAVRHEYRALRQSYERVALVGFSMGGSLATIVTAEEPVDRLVLIAPYYGVTYQWYYVLPPELWNRLTAWLIPYAIRSDFFVKVNRKEVKDQIYSYRVISSRAAGALIALGCHARRHEVLEQIRCPVLLLHSRGDEAASPARSQRAFNAMASLDKRAVWYEASNHILLWDHDRQAVTDEIVSFLTPLFPTLDATTEELLSPIPLSATNTE